jgi:FeS assembly SUF system protein
MKPLPMVPQDAPPSPDTTSETAALVADPARTDALRDEIQRAIKTVYDPEIPVDIWELGLIYDLFVTADGVAAVKMTLTAPGCPAAQVLPSQVADAVRGVQGVSDARVDVVWEPGWTKDRMSDAAKLQLGLW